VIPVEYRAYKAGPDTAFLFSAWIGSYRDSPWAGTLPQHLATPVHKATINQLLARGMRVVMAVNPDDADQILGFIAYEPGVLHYIFVKDVFRRQGIAGGLLALAGFDRDQQLTYTFRTADVAKLKCSREHRPELARRKPKAA
jgi:hypothetical protein